MRITRDSGQEAVVIAYMRHFFLLVQYCTGFGKGKAALDAVKKRVRENKHRRLKGLIVVHNINAQTKTWPMEIEDWWPEIMYESDYAIVCYQSLKKFENCTFDWMISDECHYYTAAYLKFFKKNKVLSHILMTGVLPEEPYKIKALKQLSNCNILTITLDLAIENEVLNEYKVNVWMVDLTPMEWNDYINLCKDVDYATNTGIQPLIRKRIGARMHFLYNLKTKYKAACYIRDQLRANNRRFVMFVGSKEMADSLSPYCLYEGRDQADYLKFLNQEVNEVASIKMIQEGANVKSLDSALMVQINGKELNFWQKLGRLMRLEIGMTASMHIIVAKNTFDQSWSERALRNVNKSRVTIRHLDASKYDHYE
jgi:superfamily II DNA or RNA helicase